MVPEEKDTKMKPEEKLEEQLLCNLYELELRGNAPAELSTVPLLPFLIC
jgi:hypothetical protein